MRRHPVPNNSGHRGCGCAATAGSGDGITIQVVPIPVVAACRAVRSPSWPPLGAATTKDMLLPPCGVAADEPMGFFGPGQCCRGARRTERGWERQAARRPLRSSDRRLSGRRPAHATGVVERRTLWPPEAERLRERRVLSAPHRWVQGRGRCGSRARQTRIVQRSPGRCARSRLVGVGSQRQWAKAAQPSGCFDSPRIGDAERLRDRRRG